jgi:hypothetical protein
MLEMREGSEKENYKKGFPKGKKSLKLISWRWDWQNRSPYAETPIRIRVRRAQ